MERLRTDAHRLIAKGADVIIPTEGVMKLPLVRNGLEAVQGVPHGGRGGGAMMANLGQRAGVRVSRSAR